MTLALLSEDDPGMSDPKINSFRGVEPLKWIVKARFLLYVLGVWSKEYSEGLYPSLAWHVQDFVSRPP